MGKMEDLEELCLTISTFDHLNHKGIYSVLRAISKMQKLKKLHLNLSKYACLHSASTSLKKYCPI